MNVINALCVFMYWQEIKKNLSWKCFENLDELRAVAHKYFNHILAAASE